MNKTASQHLVKVCLVLLVGAGFLYLIFLTYRKPQLGMQETEELSVGVKPIFEQDLAALFGTNFFIDHRLRFLQSVELVSSHPFFGGWSGLFISEDEAKLTAVSDTGHWLEADLLQHNDKVVALKSARIGPLRDKQGISLRSTGYGDIEAITMSSNHVYLGHESQRSGIWSAEYRKSLENSGFSRWESPADIDKLPIGRGLEALTLIEITPQQIALLAIAERNYGKNDNRTPAWLLDHNGQVKSSFFIDLSDGYDVSDASFNSKCGFFILERKLSIFGRFYVRLVQLEFGNHKLSEPTGQHNLFEASTAGVAIDNMEALAVVSDQDGGCHIFVLSDSNYLPIQKTILLKFGYR